MGGGGGEVVSFPPTPPLLPELILQVVSFRDHHSELES